MHPLPLQSVTPLHSFAHCLSKALLHHPSTPQVQHGTGNATIMSQAMPYCGGEAFLVNEVLLPCGDVSAIMGEVANIPSPCKSNVESALQKNELTNYNALLLATGVQQPIYSSGKEGCLGLPAGSLNRPSPCKGRQCVSEGTYYPVPV
jgi:hypothetical protein